MSTFDPARLRTLRRGMGVTAAELARRLRLSAAQIHRLETGQRRLTVDGLLAYCDALGMEPAALFATVQQVPVTGIINSEFQIEPLPADISPTTAAPILAPNMDQVAALRWASSGRLQPMRDHMAFYQRLRLSELEHGMRADQRAISWGTRSLVTRTDGSQCLGWPIQDNDRAHIDFGSGPVEFSVDIVRADPVIAVMSPVAMHRLQSQLTQSLATEPATGS